MLATNSFVSRMFSHVPLSSSPLLRASFRAEMTKFASRRAGHCDGWTHGWVNETTTVGGSWQAMLKYENGARLPSPALLSVEMKPIGRGVCAEEGVSMRNSAVSRQQDAR